MVKKITYKLRHKKYQILYWLVLFQILKNPITMKVMRFKGSIILDSIVLAVAVFNEES